MGAREQSRRPAGWWADRSIRTKGLVVLCVPIVILLAVLGSTSWFAHVSDRAEVIGGQARKGLVATGDLDAKVLGAENDVEDFVLTHNSSYVATYTDEGSSAATLLGSLRRSATQTTSERRALSAVVTSTDRVMSDLANVVRQRLPVSGATSQGFARTSESDSATFGRAISSLERAFTAVSNSEHNTIRLSYIYLVIVTLGGALLAVAGGIAVTQLFTSGATSRLRRLERATATLERGDLPSELPGGRDEIGRLSERLLAAASQLRDRADERDGARRQLEDILTASPVVSLRYDVVGRRFSYASPNVQRLLGIPPEVAMADPSAVIDRFHPEDSKRLANVLIEKIRQRGLPVPTTGLESFFESPGGSSTGPSSDRGSIDHGTPTRDTRQERVEIALRFRRDPTKNQWGEADAIYTLEFDSHDRLLGVVAYIVDASEQRAAQRAADERRSMLETIFHASPDTIVVRDVVGRIMLASSTLADVIGVGQRSFDRSQLPGDPSTNVNVSSKDREMLESLTARCLAGEPTPDPVITNSKLPAGEVRTFETRARAVLDHDGHVIGTVTVSRDITDRTQLEQSLREASAEAARASEAKSEFLSRMSHELRTPLNAILGFAQLLELDDLAEDQSSSVDQIQKAGRHLLSLINEVLDISRIEAGRLSLSAEPVLVGDVLDEVTALLAPAAESAELKLTIVADGARDLYVRADRQRLLQVLLNLGSNALKYNERGGSVSFRTFGTSGRRVRFEVRDSGPGIPREQQDQLFVPFSRLGAERSGVEGTGVGLALSKQLVELMGGSIGVESLLGHGSTFWVELLAAERTAGSGRRRSPAVGRSREALRDETSRTGGHETRDEPDLLASLPGRGLPGPEVAEAEPAPEPVTMSSPGSTDRTTPTLRDDAAALRDNPAALREDPAAFRDGTSSLAGILYGSPGFESDTASELRESQRRVVVLQIEDNSSNAALVKQVLARRSAVRLVTSAEGRAGLELAREHSPDLILLDLHLPDIPGEELLHRLKAVPELGSTKVVVVSADATPSRIRRMLELGVEGYLTKPVDVEALLRLVDLEIAGAQVRVEPVGPHYPTTS